MATNYQSKYKTKIFKSGNSYTLRVPRQYAEEHALELGQEVEVVVSPVLHVKKFDVEAAKSILAEIRKTGPLFPEFKTIDDIVEWQREIRRDRPILGRDY